MPRADRSAWASTAARTSCATAALRTSFEIEAGIEDAEADMLDTAVSEKLNGFVNVHSVTRRR
jgi:hypothetical protein